MSKGKAVPHPTTQPHAHKVTRIMTPMPEVDEVVIPPPPITRPSQACCSPLFAEPNGSGDEHVWKGAPMSSGE